MPILELVVKKVLIQLLLFCEKHGSDENVDKMNSLLGFSPEEDLNERLKEVVLHLELSVEKEPSRYCFLLQKSDLTDLGIEVLEFTIACVYFPEIQNLISKFFISRDGVSMEDVLKITGRTVSLEKDYEYLKATYQALKKCLILPENDSFFFRRPMKADKRLIAWLCMEDEMENDLNEFAEFYDAEDVPVLYINQNVAAEIGQLMKDPEVILQLAGSENVGRKYLLKNACAKERQNMLFVSFSALMKACRWNRTGEIPDKLEQFLLRLKREMMLYDMGICFHEQEEAVMPGEEQHILRIVLYCISQMLDQPFPVCLTTDEKMHLIDQTDLYIRKISVSEADRTQRKALWDGYCGFYDIRGINTAMMAQKYRLNAGEIAKAVRRIQKAGWKANDPEIERKLAFVCEEVLPSPVCGQIQMNGTKMKMEDLKIPEYCRKLLLEICAQVNHRKKVFDEWGMEAKYPYGRNISALLVGPPGTGKTMAVDIISGMINLPVYKINLSQVVDKYIGETEKKLEEVFNLAQKSNTILFFDEADSIFGKRSEVNEAKDRYANTEVSYILQRIEQYDGVVLLASNFKNNIDEAFLRRMRYLIEFPMPDEATREEIWRGCFTDKVWTEDLDFPYLAKTFELSGGSIKNVVLNALFLAADEGSDINMKHVLISLRNEKMKMGKPMILSDFGQYAGLMQF